MASERSLYFMYGNCLRVLHVSIVSINNKKIIILYYQIERRPQLFVSYLNSMWLLRHMLPVCILTRKTFDSLMDPPALFL